MITVPGVFATSNQTIHSTDMTSNSQCQRLCLDVEDLCVLARLYTEYATKKRILSDTQNPFAGGGVACSFFARPTATDTKNTYIKISSTSIAVYPFQVQLIKQVNPMLTGDPVAYCKAHDECTMLVGNSAGFYPVVPENSKGITSFALAQATVV